MSATALLERPLATPPDADGGAPLHWPAMPADPDRELDPAFDAEDEESVLSSRADARDERATDRDADPLDDDEESDPDALDAEALPDDEAADDEDGDTRALTSEDEARV